MGGVVSTHDKKPIIGFKAGGTGIPVLKKLKEKEPFYASVYEKNVLKSAGDGLGTLMGVPMAPKNRSDPKSQLFSTKKNFGSLSVWVQIDSY